MACGPCGGKRAANTEYLLTYKKDGSTERVASLGEARLKLAQNGGGTKELVPKLSK